MKGSTPPEERAEARAGARARSEATGRVRRWLLAAGKALATVVVTWFILDRVGVTWAEVAALDPGEWRPAWGLLLLSALLLLAGLVLHAFFWGRITAELGGEPVHGPSAVGIHFTANLFRYVPGKVWQLMGLAWLAQRREIPVRPALGGAVVSQAMTLVGAGLVGSSALLARPGVPGALGWAAVALLVALAAAASVPGVLRWALTLGARLAGRDLPQHHSVDGTFGLRWLALHAAVWVVVAGAFWVMARSFGVEGTPMEIGPAYAAAYLLGYLAVFAPAGLGVREGVLVAFLAPGIGPASAFALSIIARFWSTVVELVPAAVFSAAELRRSALRGPSET